MSVDKETAEGKHGGGLSGLEITFLDEVSHHLYFEQEVFWDKRRA